MNSGTLVVRLQNTETVALKVLGKTTELFLSEGA